MTCSFARVTAVLSMKADDYYANGEKWRLRLHEKGGKFLEVPVHQRPKSTWTHTSTPLESKGTSGARCSGRGTAGPGS